MSPSDSPLCVRHFRHILLWPLQVSQSSGSPSTSRRPWKQLLEQSGPWQPLRNGFDPAQPLTPEQYSEFVTFLPAVQRFLYGEGAADDPAQGMASVQRFRRTDLRQLRLISRTGQPPVLLKIEQAELLFFYDIDVMILAVEVWGNDLPLPVVQDVIHRLGHAYPTGWDGQGQGSSCSAAAEWLDQDGNCVIRSDAGQQERFLWQAAQQRIPAIAADWQDMLLPLLHHTAEGSAPLRYRQIDYDRMPSLSFLSVDQPDQLSRADFVRLALGSEAGPSERLPCAASWLRRFEHQYCFDRDWIHTDPDKPAVRLICTGPALVMVAGTQQPGTGPDPATAGLLAQFRNQYFLIGLMSHFHKAALVMFGDRLSSAVSRLNIRNADSVKTFKRVIRQTFETFLRFTHRCWFHDVSAQPTASTLFFLWRKHLGTEPLYDGLRREVQDMAQYLDSDGLRRQANTVVRLTVVTIFGLIATITTGFLGINLLSMAEDPLWMRSLVFLATFVGTMLLTIYTLMVSKRLSDMLEMLSDERLPLKLKLGTFVRAWKFGFSRAPVASYNNERKE